MEFSVQFPSSSSILNDSCNAWRVVTLLAATHSHHLTCTYLYHLMPSAASASRFHLDCRVRRLDFDEIYPNQLKDFEIKAGLNEAVIISYYYNYIYFLGIFLVCGFHLVQLKRSPIIR